MIHHSFYALLKFMTRNSFYIKSTAQISIQQPLCEDWMENPIWYDSNYVRSLEPDYKQYIPPMEARRMTRIMKRSLTTSNVAIKKSGLVLPDAIITGTGWGCMDNTEQFLEILCNEGEQLLKPTLFIQSTHNTISSHIAINTCNNGYNITYSHRCVSFDMALFDAYLQYKSGKIDSALVGSHDEVTPTSFVLLKKMGLVGCDDEICGEASVSTVLSSTPSDAHSAVAAIRIIYKPSVSEIHSTVNQLLADAEMCTEDISAVMVGISGNKTTDKPYYDIVDSCFRDKTILHYKHVFGECFSASAFGFYAADCCLKYGYIPEFLYVDKLQGMIGTPKTILLINHSDGKNFSFILLRSV